VIIGEECIGWEEDRPVSAIGSVTQLTTEEVPDIVESVVGFEIPVDNE